MAPPSAVPKNGKRIGKRNSWFKTSSACPPTGKPVPESRGPAWFSAKPRSEVPPPAKYRSGSGKSQRDGVAIWRQNPQARGTREAKPPFDGIVSRILKEKAQKTGAGTPIRVRMAEVHAIKTSLGGVGGIVPRVAEPGHTELRNQRWLLEQRDFLRRNIQVRNKHFAESIPIQHRGPS